MNAITPMRLLRIPAPFDDPQFIFELKLDGFRAIAHVDGGGCTLTSRNGHLFKQWATLRADLARSLRADSAVIDGELVCLARDGRPDFYRLMFRRDEPFFFAFDLLAVDGEDLRARPLLERKRRLKAVMPQRASRVRYVDHVPRRGCAFFEVACQRDLEGIVAKWARGTYQDGTATSWLKIKNPHYSQMEGRRELFETRRDRSPSVRPAPPRLVLA